MVEEHETPYEKAKRQWEAENPNFGKEHYPLMAEDVHLAMEMFGPLFPFHPSPFSSFTNLN